MTIEQLDGRHPLRIEEYLCGHTRAYGIFKNRFGNLRRRFEVAVEGYWDGKTLTLAEDFVYADGQTEQRTWHIKKIDQCNYEGRANGVIGLAKGSASGNVLRMRYRFALEVGHRAWTVHFDDRLLLGGENVLINHAKITKFGLRVGEVICIFLRSPHL